MDFHAHQVISRYLVFYVFRKTKQKKTSVNIFSLRTFSYYFIMRSDLSDPSSDLPEF